MRHLSGELRRQVESSKPDEVSRVLTAVSGGADSVALLRLLTAVPGLEQHVVHCNFHLRGDESMRDELFVRRLCAELHVPLTVVNFDVAAYQAHHGVSVEMACRELRYEKFAELRERLECQRVAVAHHLDDNLETMLLNLLRGTGLRGLCGMSIDDGALWRPLIETPRRDILDYLQEAGQDFVIDSTNLEIDVKRNFLRNEILPALKTRWPGLVKSLSRTQSNLRADLALLDHTDTSESLTPEELHRHNEPQSLIFQYISRCGGTGQQAREIARAVKAGAYPRRWQLPGGQEAVLDRDGLSISETSGASTPIEMAHTEVEVDSALIYRLKKHPDNQLLYTDLPPERLHFRHPRSGDRIAPLGMTGTSLVSDVLKDAKLTLAERADIVVATDDSGEVIWVEGFKRSRRHLLTPGRPGYKFMRIEKM